MSDTTLSPLVRNVLSIIRKKQDRGPVRPNEILRKRRWRRKVSGLTLVYGKSLEASLGVLLDDLATSGLLRSEVDGYLLAKSADDITDSDIVAFVDKIYFPRRAESPFRPRPSPKSPFDVTPDGGSDYPGFDSDLGLDECEPPQPGWGDGIPDGKPPSKSEDPGPRKH